MIHGRFFGRNKRSPQQRGETVVHHQATGVVGSQGKNWGVGGRTGKKAKKQPPPNWLTRKDRKREESSPEKVFWKKVMKGTVTWEGMGQ